MTSINPTVLLILDGWGYRKTPDHNAIALANTPTWDNLWANCPHTLLSASGQHVGLPEGQMGNSEVGHLTLGAGRIILQDLTRIDKAIEEKSFFQNETLQKAFAQAQEKQSNIHILGCLSPGGVHAHTRHIQALIQMAQRYEPNGLYVHGFLDGRDTPPKSAQKSIEAIEALLAKKPNGQIASLIGRYYAMDRDQNWDRVQKAYDLLTQGTNDFTAKNANPALLAAYDRGETDEFLKPTQILQHNNPETPILIQDQDIVIFANFRADRARALTQAFTAPKFTAFTRKKHPKNLTFVTMTKYHKDFQASIAFPTISPQNNLGETLQKHHLTQLRLAETEKYAHVTFFLNGGQEKVFEGETRHLIPSPQVATYDLKPQMRAPEITDYLQNAILSQQFDVIICNYANADMVGHTGKLQPTIQAIETLDACLAKILNALKTTNGQALITADHGNAEMLHDPITQQAHTAHTLSKVPLVYIGPQKLQATSPQGNLADVAPTLLSLMNLTPPNEMTGHTLFKKR